MPRSILTEKLSRRGYHLTREYGIDPLELALVRDVMSALEEDLSPQAPPSLYAYADATTRRAAEIMATEGLETLPVVDRSTMEVCGELSLKDLLHGRAQSMQRETERLRLFGAVPPKRRILNA